MPQRPSSLSFKSHSFNGLRLIKTNQAMSTFIQDRQGPVHLHSRPMKRHLHFQSISISCSLFSIQFYKRPLKWTVSEASKSPASGNETDNKKQKSSRHILILWKYSIYWQFIFLPIRKNTNNQYCHSGHDNMKCRVWYWSIRYCQ